MAQGTILEMIEEWRKGCSIAGPQSDRPDSGPEHCPVCTRGLIDAIEARLRRAEALMTELAAAELPHALLDKHDKSGH